MNKIITISREFGSGGRTIGKLTAQQLGIPCYDAQLIQKIAEESGFSAEYIQHEDESAGRLDPLFSSRVMGLTIQDRIWHSQRRVILDLAEKGPCVIVGRCADHILKEKADLLRVFIHASVEKRAQRIVSEYGEREESPEQRIRDKDRRRAAYHRFYTDMK